MALNNGVPLLQAAEDYIKTLLGSDSGGHDHFHALRVRNMAVRLARAEGADETLCALAALLHDADDEKLFPDTHAAQKHTVTFLQSCNVPPETVAAVCGIISQVSFKGADSVVPDTLEGKCVQDADRLDAIGAVGIARTFAFGGSHGRKLYDPDEPPRTGLNARTYRQGAGCTVNHFYEKLFLLKDMMNTAAAREIAGRRDAFLREFLNEFLDEWDGVC